MNQLYGLMIVMMLFVIILTIVILLCRKIIRSAPLYIDYFITRPPSQIATSNNNEDEFQNLHI
jgi:hypothetical protein